MVPAAEVMAGDDGRKKACPTRGRRYSYAVKKEILKFVTENNVEAAAKKYGVTETSVYEWLRAGKRRGTDTGDLPPVSTGPGPAEEEDPKEVRDRQVLAMWHQHPGYGPSQFRNMLKRGGFRI